MFTATAGLPAVCGLLSREVAGTRWSRRSQQYVLFWVLRRKCSAVRQRVESLLRNALFQCRRRRAPPPETNRELSDPWDVELRMSDRGHGRRTRGDSADV